MIGRRNVSQPNFWLHNLARARTVPDLAEQLARIDDMREELRAQDAGITTTPPSIHI